MKTRGVLHRDLKPQNVMVGPFGEVLVMDWGLAKVLSEDASDGEAPPAAKSVRESDTGDGAVGEPLKARCRRTRRSRADCAANPALACWPRPKGVRPAMDTILLVHDAGEARDVLSRSLTGAGYHIVAAPDGGDAIAFLATFSPSLIVLDNRLPSIRSDEVLAWIGRQEHLRSVPVLLLTELEMGAYGDVVAILRKPITDERLLTTVRALIARCEPMHAQ